MKEGLDKAYRQIQSVSGMWKKALGLFQKNLKIYCCMYVEEGAWVKERIICKYAMFDF